MIKFFSFISICIGLLNSPAISQDKIDSCKVFVVNYAAKYYVRISPENLMYGVYDSSFQISDTIYNKVLSIFKNESKFLEDKNLVKTTLNRYSVDCRLVFLLYHGKSYDILGFGSNGLMMFNDKVYVCKKEFLSEIGNATPGLSKFLNL